MCVMAVISIRNVPDETARRLKIAAATSGLTIRQFVLQLIENANEAELDKPKRKKAS